MSIYFGVLSPRSSLAVFLSLNSDWISFAASSAETVSVSTHRLIVHPSSLLMKFIVCVFIEIFPTSYP